MAAGFCRTQSNLFLKKCGEPKFTWGTNSAHTSIEVEGKTRGEYIEALKSADAGDFRLLMKFVRS